MALVLPIPAFLKKRLLDDVYTLLEKNGQGG
jgi:hypothetical protein